MYPRYWDWDDAGSGCGHLRAFRASGWHGAAAVWGSGAGAASGEAVAGGAWGEGECGERGGARVHLSGVGAPSPWSFPRRAVPREGNGAQLRVAVVLPLKEQ